MPHYEINKIKLMSRKSVEYKTVNVSLLWNFGNSVWSFYNQHCIVLFCKQPFKNTCSFVRHFFVGDDALPLITLNILIGSYGICVNWLSMRAAYLRLHKFIITSSARQLLFFYFYELVLCKHVLWKSSLYVSSWHLCLPRLALISKKHMHFRLMMVTH